MDSLAAGSAFRERVEVGAGPAIVRARAPSEMVGIVALLDERKKRLDGVATVPTTPRSSTASCRARQPGISTGRCARSPGRTGGTGSPSLRSAACRSSSSPSIRTRTGEPGHADIERIVVFDVLLAAQSMDDRRFSLRASSTTSSCAAQPAPQNNVSAAAVIQQLGEAAQLVIVGPHCRRRGQEPVWDRLCQGPQRHIARNHDHGYASSGLRRRASRAAGPAAAGRGG